MWGVAKAIAPSSGSAPLVLIVDDNADTRDLLGEFLNFFGARSLAAPTVAVASAILERTPEVALILTDYAMPGEDGISLLSRLRASPKWRRLPVIVVSGHDPLGELAREARTYGAEFLPKPIQLDALARLVQDALSGARATRTTNDHGTAPTPLRADEPDVMDVSKRSGVRSRSA